MGKNDVLYQRETQAGSAGSAAGRVVDAVKPVKDPVLLVGSDSYSFVLYPYGDAAVFRSRTEYDMFPPSVRI